MGTRQLFEVICTKKMFIPVIHLWGHQNYELTLKGDVLNVLSEFATEVKSPGIERCFAEQRGKEYLGCHVDAEFIDW